jgi:MoaA/NifB/PqqE/SkfB family radical SAM enzyme
MIGISKLYCGTVEPSDALRYGRHSSTLPSHLLQFSKDKRPVVVWNVTRKCNLKCVHCYAQATEEITADELTTDEGKALIDDLAQFGAPVMLFSGGEPLVRKDLPELAAYAVEKGMRAVISTNGTLITADVARRSNPSACPMWASAWTACRGSTTVPRRPGAYDKALEGIRNCQDAGIKVGLRFTINKFNVGEIPAIFDLLEEMDIPRVCFYHLVYAGRGSKPGGGGPEPGRNPQGRGPDHRPHQSAARQRQAKEVLTVDNHADGPYLYLRMLKEDPERAAEVLELLKMNEGNNSGRGIGCVSWDGEVYADQFWRHHSFGNVRQRPFSQIWTDSRKTICCCKLKDKKQYVTAAAPPALAGCLRRQFPGAGRGDHGDVWAPDPACYLTDEEIAQTI